MSVRQAQQEISSVEFAEWVAYYQLEPFGEDRADLRCGNITSTLINGFTALGGKTGNSKATDFILGDYDLPQERTREKGVAMGKIFAQIAAAQNQKVKRHGNNQNPIGLIGQ